MLPTAGQAHYLEFRTPMFCKLLWVSLCVSTVIFASVFVILILGEFSYSGLALLGFTFLLVNSMLIWAIWAFGRYFIKASQSNITFGYSHWNVSIDVETIALIETIEIKWIKWGGVGWRVRSGKEIGYITGNGTGVRLCIDGGKYYEFNCDNPQELIEGLKI